jgi:hypothetical protein
VVKRLEKELGIKTAGQVWANPQYRKRNYPFDTQVAGATGAALFAHELLKMGKAKSVRKTGIVE